MPVLTYERGNREERKLSMMHYSWVLFEFSNEFQMVYIRLQKAHPSHVGPNPIQLLITAAAVPMGRDPVLGGGRQ